MDPPSRITRIKSQIRNQQPKKLLYTNLQQNSMIFPIFGHHPVSTILNLKNLRSEA